MKARVFPHLGSCPGSESTFFMTEQPIKIIKPSQDALFPDLREVWRYRDTVFYLVLRNIRARFKQTVLGPLWGIIQPIVLMAVFSFVFGQLAKLPSGGVPYPIFNFAGLIPWLFFANSLTRVTMSLVGNSSLLTKIYFPRIILPIVDVITILFDSLVSFIVLIVMMVLFQITPTSNIIWLPALTLLALITALGIGLWAAALNVRFRDIGLGMQFLVRVWMYLTPVVYDSSILPAPWDQLYGLNPMAGVVEGFRWALLGMDPTASNTVLLSVVMSITLLVTGLMYFNRVEAIFADVV
jgi:lipopolysaccharide transport system permease protein